MLAFLAPTQAMRMSDRTTTAQATRHTLHESQSRTSKYDLPPLNRELGSSVQREPSRLVVAG